MDLSNENVIHKKENGIEFLQFRKLLEYKDVINHAYSIGTDLNFRTAKANKQKISEKEFELAINSYNNLCVAIDTDMKKLVKTNQEHTKEVKIVQKKVNEEKPDFNLEEYRSTDGLITNKKNIILSTTNADCILLLFFDPVKKVIANIHSGWKGTIQRISVMTVRKMVKEFQCNPEDIICCICPSIRACHFEVEKDVKKQFEQEFKDLNPKKNWIEEKIPNKKWNIDTVFINKEILKKENLKDEKIIDSGICSVCHSDKIHSYRVEKEGYGLNTALIELK